MRNFRIFQEGHFLLPRAGIILLGEHLLRFCEIFRVDERSPRANLKSVDMSRAGGIRNMNSLIDLQLSIQSRKTSIKRSRIGVASDDKTSQSQKRYFPVSPGPAEVGGALFTSLDGFLFRLTVGNIIQSLRWPRVLKNQVESEISDNSVSFPPTYVSHSHGGPRNTQNVVESPQQQKMGQAKTFATDCMSKHFDRELCRERNEVDQESHREA
jgi:hypothetical protein